MLLRQLLILTFLFVLAAQGQESFTFDNEDIRVAIPNGWVRVTQNPPFSAGSTGIRSGVLVIEKQGYFLTLAYQTSHASGAEGGRFIEAFSIPWLNTDDAWTCSLVLKEVSQPASRTLMFVNLTLNTGDSAVRSRCGLAKALAVWKGEGAEKKLYGDWRWVAGYFSTDLGYFFNEGYSSENSCQSKVYSLTTSATKPEQLPDPSDPKLKNMIQQAIDIVNSIHYKRCPPSMRR